MRVFSVFEPSSKSATRVTGSSTTFSMIVPNRSDVANISGSAARDNLNALA